MVQKKVQDLRSNRCDSSATASRCAIARDSTRAAEHYLQSLAIAERLAVPRCHHDRPRQ